MGRKGLGGKWHLSPHNKRRKTSPNFESRKNMKGAQISKHTLEKTNLCDSGYTRSQGWGLLHKAWLGYKIASNPRHHETFWDRLQWASTIQSIQTDLGIARTSFPQLGLLGDITFLYDKSKELELQNEHDELWFKDYRKKKRQHIKEIVEAGNLSETEIEMLRADPYVQLDSNNRYVERVVMVDKFVRASTN